MWVGARGRRRRSLWWSTVEGTLGAASDNLAVPYLGLFALAAGGGPREVALATAVPALAATVLQPLFGYLTSAAPGRRRALWLGGSLPARLLWLVVAALPWLVPPGPGLWAAYLGLLALRGLFVALMTPAWTALMADLTHRAWRASYFAVRNVLGNLAALVGAVAAGYAASVGYPHGYALLFLAAGLVGLLSVGALARVEELPPLVGRSEATAHAAGSGAGATSNTPAPRPAGRGLGRWRQEAPGFGRFAVASVLWNLAVNLPVGLFPVHFTVALGGSPSLWGVANGATFLTTMLGQRLWARRCDRRGGRPVLVSSGLGCITIPLLWALAPSPGWVVAINLFSGYVWAGYNLAVFNLVLETTPDARRPAYVGLFNMGVGLATAAGPVLGAALVGTIGMEGVMVLSALLRSGTLTLFTLPQASSTPGRPAPPPVVPGWERIVQSGLAVGRGLAAAGRRMGRRAGSAVDSGSAGDGAGGVAPPG